MQEQRAFTGSEWETKAGYCRAIRKGLFISVSGTVARGNDGSVVGEGSVYAQTKRCFTIIEKAILELGGSFKDITRTRIFTTDISKWDEIAKAHKEFFSMHPPAMSMYEVSKLIDPRYLVEIEVEAIVSEDENKTRMNSWS